MLGVAAWVVKPKPVRLLLQKASVEPIDDVTLRNSLYYCFPHKINSVNLLRFKGCVVTMGHGRLRSN